MRNQVELVKYKTFLASVELLNLLTRKNHPETTVTGTIIDEYNTEKFQEFWPEIIFKHGLKEVDKPGYSESADLFEKSSKKGKKDGYKIEKLADFLLFENYRYIIFL